MNTYFIIHGSFGNNAEHYIPWLKNKLEDCGHKVVAYIGNDRSTDKTGEICLNYATRYTENVVLIENEHNR